MTVMFSIVCFLACAFLVYVLGHFHQELRQHRAPRPRQQRAYRSVTVMLPPRHAPASTEVVSKRAPEAA